MSIHFSCPFCGHPFTSIQAMVNHKNWCPIGPRQGQSETGDSRDTLPRSGDDGNYGENDYGDGDDDNASLGGDNGKQSPRPTQAEHDTDQSHAEPVNQMPLGDLPDRRSSPDSRFFCNHPKCSLTFRQVYRLQQHVWSHSEKEAQLACTCAKAPKKHKEFKKHQAKAKCQKLDRNRTPSSVNIPIYGYFGTRGERNTFRKISELL